ncbi:rhodanese-like domain-containing protein [Haloprofundus halophilus]|uniref:rhodanese-like domain-containing protein n=1 Tax=Haloprofundus halophilus TaxID=2283527 RepID=UPI0018E4DD77|nr:rhodanese-like domain-containing protein [Haloprofundus halophilus]
MQRRTFLAAAGTAGAAALAGCSNSSSSGTPDNNTNGYETLTVDGSNAQVPLAPIEDVHQWFQDGSAKFADARGQRQYDASHIEGAVLSPAPDGRANDPTGAWDESQRIVTYCGCPHHLSSMRAASLIDSGYTEVFALDEGFFEWRDRGYPLQGAEVDVEPPSYTVRGRTDASLAGKNAWARHEQSEQREAGPIADDGSFELVLHFYDVTESSPIVVETPEYRIERPLGELAETVVTDVER